MSNPTCKTCRWWKCSGGVVISGGVEKPNEDYGHCYRRSPVQSKLTSDGWPKVHADDFCGEHEAAREFASNISLIGPGLAHDPRECRFCGHDLEAAGVLRTARPFIFEIPCKACGRENRLRESDFELMCTCKNHNSHPLCWFCEIRTGVATY